jgi:hypothetical protein
MGSVLSLFPSGNGPFSDQFARGGFIEKIALFQIGNSLLPSFDTILYTDSRQLVIHKKK